MLLKKLLATAAIAVSLGAVAPMTASAATAPHYSNNCTTGRIESIAHNLPIRDLPYLSSPVVRTAQVGDHFDCTWQSEPTGDRYNACGHYGANAWIEIRLGDTWGYSYMVCWKDVPVGT